jgi:hypothetical protein
LGLRSAQAGILRESGNFRKNRKKKASFRLAHAPGM